MSPKLFLNCNNVWTLKHMTDNNDIVSITRQFLTIARSESKSEVGTLVTGLPQAVLDRLATLDLAQIESLARAINVSLITLRLDADELDRLLTLSDKSRPTYALSVISNPKRERQAVRKRVAKLTNVA